MNCQFRILAAILERALWAGEAVRVQDKLDFLGGPVVTRAVHRFEEVGTRGRRQRVRREELLHLAVSAFLARDQANNDWVFGPLPNLGGAHEG